MATNRFRGKSIKQVCSTLCLLLSVNLSYQAIASSKVVIGWVESARIYTENITLKAKIDTGADNTSLHASNLRKFSIRDKEWVRFELEDEDGNAYTIERPVIRYTSIKRRGVASQERPVIQMKICVGSYQKQVEVNLTDRTNYSYKLLISRSYLEGLFLVDSERMFTVKPDCIISER